MIHNIYQHLFKPEYLVINPQGALRFDHKLNLINISHNPDELQHILSQNRSKQKPLRIIIDAYDHNYTKTYSPAQNFWQQYRFSKQLEAHQNFSNSTIFLIYKNDATHVTSVSHCDNLTTWMQAVNVSGCFILSIESLAVGLSLTAHTPHLYIFPDRFNHLRFMFASGQGGLFCRSVNCNIVTPPLIEIQRTIHYVCREFMISSTDINVVSSFQCPEIQPVMGSWQNIPITAEHYERYFISLLNTNGDHLKFTLKTKIKISRLKFVWNRLRYHLALTIATILTAINTIHYYHNNNLQQEIDHIQNHNSIKQHKFDTLDYDTRLLKYQQLRLNNQPYVRACQTISEPLKLLRRLSLTNIVLPPIMHLVYAKTDHPIVHARLLLEFKISHDDQNNDDIDKNIHSYIDFLQTQFTGATITVDQKNLTSGSSSMDFANESWPAASIIIQINNIKI